MNSVVAVNRHRRSPAEGLAQAPFQGIVQLPATVFLIARVAPETRERTRPRHAHARPPNVLAGWSLRLWRRPNQGARIRQCCLAKPCIRPIGASSEVAETY